MNVWQMGWFNFQENVLVLVRRLNELRWQHFFLDFMKGLPLQITAREYVIKLYGIKLCLRDDFEIDTF